jgi:hypothetical protein
MHKKIYYLNVKYLSFYPFSSFFLTFTGASGYTLAI